MVGLLSTALLLQAGLSVLLTDQLCAPPQRARHPARVSALNRASYRLFESLGLSSEFLNHAGVYDDMHIWESEHSPALHFAAHALGEPQLGWIVSNDDLCDLLWSYCQSYQSSGQLITAWNLNVEDSDALWHDGKWTQSLNISADFLIAADGAHSQIRTAQQIPTATYSYDQTALTCVIQLEKTHARTAWQRFLGSREGPVALLPLQDPHQGVIVWSCTPTEAERLTMLPESEFIDAWNHVFEATHLTGVDVLSPRLCFPLKAQHAQTYTFPGGALVGDAAHQIHPLAGQGVNLGFQDAASLCMLLIQGHQTGRPLSSPHLAAKYELSRRLYNQATQKSMTCIREWYARPMLKGFRTCAMKTLNHPILKAILLELALGTIGSNRTHLV
jgi:2-octaprenylphenol hydroxylase